VLPSEPWSNVATPAHTITINATPATGFETRGNKSISYGGDKLCVQSYFQW